MNEDLHARIEHNMRNHAPINDTVVEIFEALRKPFIEAANTAATLCPPGRELSICLADIETALSAGIAAIARNQWTAYDQWMAEREIG